MKINYDHAANLHTLEGAQTVMNILVPLLRPGSILDVGCGMGVWLKAANDLGVTDTVGIDGVAIPPEKLLIPSANFRQVDLTTAWSLGRHFDLALCLEVAEHLDEMFTSKLIGSLTQYADTVLFSAASPYQPGQHHVNCQWPSYWQHLFNLEGYACDDIIRPQLWNNALVEPWYRQNIFIAKKNPGMAGKEPRLQACIHPDMLPYILDYQKGIYPQQVAQGQMPFSFYLALPFQASFQKLKRFLKEPFQK